MKTLLCILTIVTILVGPAYGDGRDEKSPSPEVRAELAALVEAWIDAEVQGDRGGLEEVLHEDFLSTFASGATVDRDAYVDIILNLEIPPFSVANEAMRVFGDTAVVIDVSEDGKTKFTWVAVRIGDQWKVIAQTFSRVE